MSTVLEQIARQAEQNAATLTAAGFRLVDPSAVHQPPQWERNGQRFTTRQALALTDAEGDASARHS